MADSYYLRHLRIWNALKTSIESRVPWLSGRVRMGYNVTTSSYPNVFVVPLDDEPRVSNLGGKRIDISPSFAVIFQNLATGDSDTDIKLVTSGVGAIIDAFNEDLDEFGSDGDRVDYTRLEIESVDYQFNSPGVNPSVIYEGRVVVRAWGEH